MVNSSPFLLNGNIIKSSPHFTTFLPSRCPCFPAAWDLTHMGALHDGHCVVSFSVGQHDMPLFSQGTSVWRSDISLGAGAQGQENHSDTWQSRSFLTCKCLAWPWVSEIRLTPSHWVVRNSQICLIGEFQFTCMMQMICWSDMQTKKMPGIILKTKKIQKQILLWKLVMDDHC